MTKISDLRDLIESPGIVVLPGAHDVLSARLIEQEGFPVVFTSGFGLSASSLGVPDVGLLTQTETLDRVKRIVDAVSVPVVADMDTGYGPGMCKCRSSRNYTGRPSLAKKVWSHGREISYSYGGAC